MLQLYDYYRSSASFRVRIALNLKNLDYQQIPIHLLNNGGEQFSDHYHTINPQALVPTLQDEENKITQSLAIIEYLDEKYPNPSLIPKDTYQRALARSFALIIGADLHPLNNLRVIKFLTDDLGLDETKKQQWYHHWIAKGLASLEKSLASSPYVGDYCFGSQPTIADIFLVPQMYNARRFQCELKDYPQLTRIDAHCQKHPAFAKAWPQET